MRKVGSLVFMLFTIALCVPAKAAQGDGAQSEIQKNHIDLLKDKFFSRPITELELILHNLNTQAKPTVSRFKSDRTFHVMRGDREPEGGAAFIPKSGKIVLMLTLHVDKMSDPWREACDHTLNKFYNLFVLPSRGRPINAGAGLMRLRQAEKYFGEAIQIDSANADNAIDLFLNSILTRVNFYVFDNPASMPRSFRSCTKDNMTGKMSYTENKLY